MKMKDVLKGMSTPKLIATLFESLRDRNVAESREFIKEATVELANRPPVQGPKGDKGDPGVGAPLINNLETGGTEAALTAEMGKEINSQISDLLSDINIVDISKKGISLKTGKCDDVHLLNDNELGLCELGLVYKKGGKVSYLNKGYVSYEDFGAKLDGKSDDTVAIQRCHTFANKLNIPVRQTRGISKITQGGFIVNTNTDLSGFTLIIDDTLSNKTIYKINQSYDADVSVNLGNNRLDHNTINLPDVSQYYDCLAIINSPEIVTNRVDGGETYPIYKKEAFKIAKKGFIDGKIHYKHDAQSINIKIKKPKNTLSFKGVTVDWVMDSSKTCTVLECSRNNVRVSDIYINVSNDSYVNTSNAYKGEVIRVFECMYCDIVNISGSNITEGKNQSGYIFNFSQVVYLNINNCKCYQGWGCIGSNNLSNVNVTNSTLNRFDVHIGTGDINITNSRFYGGWGLFIGYGKGNILLTSVTWDKLDSDGRLYKECIASYGTYGITFGGNISMVNCILNDYTDVLKINIYGLTFSSDAGHSQNDNIMTPNLTIDNLLINDLSPKNSRKDYILYDFNNMNQIENNLVSSSKKLILPTNIRTSNILLSRLTSVDGRDHNLFVVNIPKISNLLTNNLVENETNVDVQNIHLKKKNIFVDFNIIEHRQDLMKYASGGMFMFRYSSGSGSEIPEPFKYKFDNCTGGFVYEQSCIEMCIKNSHINKFDVQGGEGANPQKLSLTGNTLIIEPSQHNESNDTVGVKFSGVAVLCAPLGHLTGNTIVIGGLKSIFNSEEIILEQPKLSLWCYGKSLLFSENNNVMWCGNVPRYWHSETKAVAKKLRYFVDDQNILSDIDLA